MIFLSKFPVPLFQGANKHPLTCWSWHPREHVKHYMCTLFIFHDEWLLFIWSFQLEFCTSSVRKGVFQMQYLISICLLDKYIPFRCKKRRRSAVMLKRPRPSRRAAVHYVHVWLCTFCANWYREITAVSSEKTQVCLQSIAWWWCSAIVQQERHLTLF